MRIDKNEVGGLASEGEARAISGGGVWGGVSVSPSPEFFYTIESAMVHFGACFAQKFERIF